MEELVSEWFAAINIPKIQSQNSFIFHYSYIELMFSSTYFMKH